LRERLADTIAKTTT